jgi:hypothetical protein
MKTKQPAFLSRLEKLGACEEAREWAAGFKSGKTAWQACERGDWMLWLAGRLSGLPESDGRKKLVLCCCECARLSLPIFQKRYPKNDCVRKCLDTAERWARGEATIEELREARASAYYAYYAAYAAYAADAADAADAASASVYYANYAAYKQCAEIVRKHYPTPPGLRAKA